MLTYTYKNKDGIVKQIVVKLADYDFIPVWIDYVQRIASKTPHIKWYAAGVNNNRQKAPPHELIPTLEHLLGNYNYFQDLGVNDYTETIELLKSLITNPEETEQKHLNMFHRHFTRLEMDYLNIQKPLPLHAELNEFWQNIQDINGYTHKLESYTYGRIERRKKYEEFLQYSVQFTNAHNLAYVGPVESVFTESNIEHIKDFKFDFFTQNYDYDVWLHEDITGKDQMKTFLDEDDLTQFDVTGNLLFTPSVTFDPHKVYKSILDDKTFRNESINCKKTLDRYPIGTIVSCENVIWDELFESEILSIYLNDKLLWG